MGINSSPSLSQVQSEFGGGNPIGLNEYYGVRFSDGSYAPGSGTISLSNFRNKSKYVAPAPSPPPAPAPAPPHPHPHPSHHLVAAFMRKHLFTSRMVVLYP